ncbi:hypothetical protein PSHT_11836 [Puccinia striiformis]|uniref:Uncharacterized protein n=1 Tax=Puccinia striiformis TaxID=27350 RepID=A0A2S4V0K7_9BASI|nr:hypothetical protein PSHT_11836 [Puccinia striiformis]
MQVEPMKSAESTRDSFNTSGSDSESKLAQPWLALETDETSADVADQPLRSLSPDGSPIVATSPNIEASDDKLNMEIDISTVKSIQMITSEKNPLTTETFRPLSTASADMIKRIVDNQNLLIWQAYDDWRQKFPRLELVEDEEIQEPSLESESQDELCAVETLAVEA